MKTFRTPNILAVVLAGLSLAAPVAAAGGPATLWIADDTEKVIYHVTLTGTLITSFSEVSGANSAICVDLGDGTLWGIDESPARVVNFTTDGDLISTFSISGATALEGVGVDPDGTLWVINDPKSGDDPSVFHLTKGGSLLDSFETSVYDSNSTSPQDIDVDKSDGTLWIADNSSDTIYNISRTGTLLSSFDTDEFGGTSNPQGLSAAPDGTLWISARDDSTIYHVTQSGSVISSFESNDYDSSSDNPTAVGFSAGRPAPSPWEDLGGGTSGDEGVPELTLGGPLTPASIVDLDLVDTPSNALAFVFISFQSSPTDFLGGTLHTFPFDLIGSFFVDSSGEFSGTAFFPGGASGAELWFQVGVEDPSVPIFGASLSNGVKGTVP